ncbi:autotransporter domain-containing protein [Salmonella enterica]|nr:autotransporter domain-containing protein [Salmonella enterica]EIQ4466797.1 autotransporter domain-containing protein [Salmonella enterica]EIS3134793.1 autotransporter domain-containing protein [Salmonella enterica]EIS3161243.1 autotransporter domain-containing protein [Salmonella enterica]EJL7558857.1 autotransporter domain-containing protein [Salmonella enterica]
MNPMQKKKLISIAIALTLQSYYIPAIAAENNDDEKECPSNISSLPKEKRAKLSPTCLATPENDNHWGWVAGGVAALVAGVAIGVENNGGGDSNHSYTPPTPDNGGDVTPPDDGGNVTPPDDGGDDNVIPPDDSGDDDVTPPDDSGDDDVTPPDDSGDDDVTPPDDSGDGDVTPPDDSGDDDVTPPDDSGDDDVTPPDDSGDDDVTPPDDSGDDDVTPPDDSGDDDVTPPDDSGDDDDTPPDDSVITFSNGVTIDKGKDTLTFDSFKLDNGSVLEGAVWNYSEQDNQWQLTTADGKTLNVTGWDVTDANAAVIEGTQENGLYWKYDSRGYLIIADDNTTVISGDDQAHNSDRGMDISGQDRTGVIISGDRTVNTLTGDSSVTDGATGMVISGDGTTNTISGHSTVDNATGALISGNGTTTNFAGDIAVSGGGTAIIIDGDNATIKNTGTSNISGAGSTGTVIDGNNARVNNDGDMTITDGGTGGHITGDNVVIDNAGSTTVSGADATALYIEGDNALVINEGNQTISGGAVGTRIDGDDAHTTNTGDIAVDGAGSAAVIINGDNGSLTQAGDLLVTDGAMGIITYGTGNEAKNTGNATVRDADSVGFVVAGEKNTFKNKGDIDVSLNGTGALVSGDMSQVTLDGDINVVSVQDSEGVFSSATGVNVSGDNNAVDITGSVNISADYGQDDLAAGAPPLTGVVVGGNGNTVTLNGDVTFYNNGDFTGSIAGTSYQQEIVNTGDMTVAEDGKSLVSGSFYFYNEEDATLTNSGSAVEGGENTIINLTRANDSLTQVNSGTITATNGYSAITTVNGSNDPKWIWNTATGVINGINPDAPLINLGRGYNFGNQGTINVQGDNAVAISGGTSSYVINLVNSGTINVGTEQGKEDGTNGTGLIGIKGNGNATTINNTADGVINVYADDSYAFGGTTKAIINNGEINLLCDSGCDIYAPGTTGTQNDHNGTADIAIPDATTAPTEGSIPTPPEDPNAPQQLSNYIVGTNADGSSGTLKANNLVIGDNVKVDTGFTSGTADTTVVVDNAFTGSNIQGADNITSTSVVWNAQGSQDADGNVDVTMTKNAYADVATDGSVSDVAQALDAGYTNNELYTSLNVGTTAELNSALKQVSGAQATTVFREARVLSNRFTMLADAAPQIKDGLAFNVVAKGDPRAELGNDTQYDMLALRQTLDLTASQNLTLEYGIARLDGDGSKTAGDNGLTGGYSQFFGLKHSMAFDEGLAWNNSLRYDVHNLDSSRSVAYGDVNKIADSDMRQQYLEFRSEGAKTFTMMSDTLKVTPYAGVKFRHTMEDGYKERSAGDFNLSMNSGNETAVDSIVGLKLDYAGKDGWSATATLEGGPNLSYSKSQRTASLQGAAGQSFGVDDGQKGGGINGLATIGVKYSSNDTALHLDAYQWKEDSISDKGFMLNVKKTFR